MNKSDLCNVPECFRERQDHGSNTHDFVEAPLSTTVPIPGIPSLSREDAVIARERINPTPRWSEPAPSAPGTPRKCTLCAPPPPNMAAEIAERWTDAWNVGDVESGRAAILGAVREAIERENEACRSLFESINPSSDAERACRLPGAGAMGAVLEYRDAIAARRSGGGR